MKISPFCMWVCLGKSQVARRVRQGARMVTIGYIMRVMIASPGDIPSHREVVEDAIHEWNDVNSIGEQVILLPWRWETSAVTQLGDHPQALLKKQGVDKSDIVIALFGSRLGSPTLRMRFLGLPRRSNGRRRPGPRCISSSLGSPIPPTSTWINLLPCGTSRRRCRREGSIWNTAN